METFVKPWLCLIHFTTLSMIVTLSKCKHCPVYAVYWTTLMSSCAVVPKFPFQINGRFTSICCGHCHPGCYSARPLVPAHVPSATRVILQRSRMMRTTPALVPSSPLTPFSRTMSMANDKQMMIASNICKKSTDK